MLSPISEFTIVNYRYLSHFGSRSGSVPGSKCLTTPSPVSAKTKTMEQSTVPAKADPSDQGELSQSDSESSVGFDLAENAEVMDEVSRPNVCQFCFRRWSAQCRQRKPNCSFCSSCDARGPILAPIGFKNRASRKILSLDLATMPRRRHRWRKDIFKYEINRKRSGRGANQYTSSSGVKKHVLKGTLAAESIDRKRTQKFVGKTKYGVFWPLKLFRQRFPNMKVRKQAKMEYDGEIGVCLSSEYGCPDGCTKLYVEKADGIERKTALFVENDVGDAVGDVAVSILLGAQKI